MDRNTAFNIIYTAISTSMAFVVPLYLLSQNVDVALIGIIVALGPLTFGILRVMLASIADEVGTLLISALCAISGALSVIFYIFIPTASGFATGTFSEGIRSSAFWAIVRTDTINNSKGDTARALARMSLVRQLADGITRLLMGFILVYLAFQGTFAIILALCILLFFMIKPRPKVPWKVSVVGTLSGHILKPRPRTFWQSASMLMLMWLPLDALVSLILPLYFTTNLGLGYQETGVLLAVLSLVTAAATAISMKWRLSLRSLVFAFAFLVPVLIAMPLVGSAYIPILLFIALGNGCANIMGEYLLTDQVFRSNQVSTDIGAIFLPLQISKFMFFSACGLIIAMFGWVPVFALCALFSLLFVVAAMRIVK